MSSISSEDIISILKEEIKNYDDRCRGEETGTVISVGDGIARIYGMDQAMYGEILLFENWIEGNGPGYQRGQHRLYFVWKGYRNQRRKPCVQDEEKSRNPSGRGVYGARSGCPGSAD